MNERRIRWNDRYSRGEETHDYRPASPLPEAVRILCPGIEKPSSSAPALEAQRRALRAPSGARALDIACGAGRHTLYLAERGFHVVAVDWSEAGLSLLAAEARKKGLEGNIETVTADIEAGDFTPSPGAFDIVCDFFFLSRPLFPLLRDAVKPGGLFVAAIHVESAGSPAPHRFLLAPGELHQTVQSWGFDILLSRDAVPGGGGHSHPTSEIIAQRRP